MSKLSERFTQAMFEKNINNAFLSKKYNISRQLVSKFFTTQKTLTDKFAEICDGENINMNWLLTGKGEMFLNNIANENIQTNKSINFALNSIIDNSKDTSKITSETEPMAFEFYLKEVCELLKEYGSFKLIWELREKLLEIKTLHDK